MRIMKTKLIENDWRRFVRNATQLHHYDLQALEPLFTLRRVPYSQVEHEKVVAFVDECTNMLTRRYEDRIRDVKTIRIYQSMFRTELVNELGVLGYKQYGDFDKHLGSVESIISLDNITLEREAQLEKNIPSIGERLREGKKTQITVVPAYFIIKNSERKQLRLEPDTWVRPIYADNDAYRSLLWMARDVSTKSDDER
jgi:hypothetical protein